MRRLMLTASLTGSLLAVTVPPFALRAQALEQDRSRLLATTRRGRMLQDSIKAIHVLRSHELPPDSVVAGELRFYFLKSNFGPDLQASLEGAAVRVLRIADSTFGDALRSIAGAAPIIATRSHSRFGEFNGMIDLVTLEIADGGGRTATVRAPVTQKKLEDGILDLLGTMATAQAPANLIQWSGEWVPSRPLTHESWEDAAINLASSNAAIARTCHAGSVPACESALGLTDVHDPLTEWYTPEGYRVLVATWRPPPDAYSIIADRVECVEKKVMEVCERLSRTRPIPIPLQFGARQTLFGLALERGGRTAYSRVAAAKGTPLQILSSISGVSADSLIREWRTRVAAAAPKSPSPSVAEAAMFVGWTVLFGFAATQRRP